MIIGLQIIAIIFALIMIYFAYLNFQRGEISKGEIVSWWSIWVVTIIIVIFPQLLRDFATKFAISRVFDLMVIAGFILVITVVYLAYIRGKRMEKKLESLIRMESLKDLKNAKKDKK